MICPKCNSDNAQGSKFCNVCGEELVVKEKKSKINKDEVVQEAKVDSVSDKFDIKELFNLVIGTLTKPVSTLKNKVKLYDDVKTSLIIGGAVSLICTVITLIRTMISSVFVEEYVGFFETKTVFRIEKLLDVNYIGIIFRNIFMFAGIIAVCALVYYLASLILKKKTNYIRLVGITSVAMIPFYLVSVLIAPIIALVSGYFSVLISIIAFVYSITIMIYAYNKELQLDGDKIVYVNAICISILLVIVYIAVLIVLESLLGSVLSIF